MRVVALVPLKDQGCPDCGGAVVKQVIWEPAPFVHGGYGATRQTTVEVCFGCGWSFVGSISEVNPRLLPVEGA